VRVKKKAEQQRQHGRADQGGEEHCQSHGSWCCEPESPRRVGYQDAPDAHANVQDLPTMSQYQRKDAAWDAGSSGCDDRLRRSGIQVMCNVTEIDEDLARGLETVGGVLAEALQDGVVELNRQRGIVP